MKTCTKCKETKPLEEYYTCKKTKSGKRSACKSCYEKDRKGYYQKNPEKVEESKRKYYQKNLDLVKRRAKKWARENPKKKRENGRKWAKENSDTVSKWRKENPEKVREYRKKWRKANPEKCTALLAKRRARKLQATPHWLTEYQHKQIELKYWISQFLTDCTGIQHHVDHIHPLQGENICGLHVPENLQILTAKENMSKSNSH